MVGGFPIEGMDASSRADWSGRKNDTYPGGVDFLQTQAYVSR